MEPHKCVWINKTPIIVNVIFSQKILPYFQASHIFTAVIHEAVNLPRVPEYLYILILLAHLLQQCRKGYVTRWELDPKIKNQMDRKMAVILDLTIKRKNNSFNEFVVILLVENEVLHKKIGHLFQKLENNKIQIGPPAAILNFASHKFSVACLRGCPPRLCS